MDVCVLYVSFGSKVRSRTFGCVAMGSALLCILKSRLLVYSAGSDVNRVQVVLSGFSMRLFSFVQSKTLCRYGCIHFLAALVLVCADVMVMVHWVVVSLRCKCYLEWVKGRHLVERQFFIDVVWMCGFYMLCRLCVPWCSLR